MDEASLRLSNRPSPAVRLTLTFFLSSPYGMYYRMRSVHRLRYSRLLTLYYILSILVF